MIHQNDIFLLGDVFEILRNLCLEMYEPDPAKCFSAPELAWQAAIKITKVKLDLLTDIDMILMVEKGIWGWIWHYLLICKS